MDNKRSMHLAEAKCGMTHAACGGANGHPMHESTVRGELTL